MGVTVSTVSVGCTSQRLVPISARGASVAPLTDVLGGCTYADCHVPPERHDSCAAKDISPCWPGIAAFTGALQHQHTPKRSQGGKECHVMLCAGHHDNIDNGTRYEGLRLSNRISHGDSGPRDYLIEDRDTGEVLLKLEVKE